MLTCFHCHDRYCVHSKKNSVYNGNGISTSLQSSRIIMLTYAPPSWSRRRLLETQKAWYTFRHEQDARAKKIEPAFKSMCSQMFHRHDRCRVSEHWEVKKKRTDFCDLKLHDVTYNNLTCRLSCVAGTRSLMLYAACNRSIMFVFSWCPWLRPVVYGVSSMLNDLHFNMTALLALEAFHHLHLTHFLGCTLYLC